MRQITFHRMFALLALLLASAPVYAQVLVTPGRSVGRVTLGSSRKTVHKILGKPSEAARYAKGLIEDRWEQQAKNPGGFHHYMTVMFQNDKAVQIKVTSPSYQTKSGISLASARSYLEQTFSGLRETSYGYDFGPIPFGSTYLDAVGSGIAFTQSGRDDWEKTETADALIVHAPNRRVIARPGYTVSDEGA